MLSKALFLHARTTCVHRVHVLFAALNVVLTLDEALHRAAADGAQVAAAMRILVQAMQSARWPQGASVVSLGSFLCKKHTGDNTG